MKKFFKENYKVIICSCVLLGLLAIALAVSPKSPQGQPSQDPSEPLPYGVGTRNYTLFNTTSTIYTYAGDTKEVFDANCAEAWSLLAEYHQLFDIYYEFSGINNLCTLNKNAGGDALEVSPKLIEFLKYAKELYALTSGEMNVMMGAVLVPWHDAREDKYLGLKYCEYCKEFSDTTDIKCPQQDPDHPQDSSLKCEKPLVEYDFSIALYCEYCHKFSPKDQCVDGKCPQQDPDYPNQKDKKCERPVITFDYALEKGSQHTSIDCLEIDEKNNTIRITDKDARIDVGALGKGYATEMTAKHLEAKGVTSYVLDIGGNLRLIGTQANGLNWTTAIKDPKNPRSNFIKKISISDISCVTSGDYERYIKINGKNYHHIIDKDTLMPAEYFSSVTILAKNSGLADALSTALFCMSYEEGLALVEKIGGVEVLWVYPDNSTKMTKGFEALLIE